MKTKQWYCTIALHCTSLHRGSSCGVQTDAASTIHVHARPIRPSAAMVAAAGAAAELMTSSLKIFNDCFLLFSNILNLSCSSCSSSFSASCQPSRMRSILHRVVCNEFSNFASVSICVKSQWKEATKIKREHFRAL